MPRPPLNILKLIEQLSPEFQQLVKGKSPRGVRPGAYQFKGDVALGGLTFSDEALALEMQKRAERLLKPGPPPPAEGSQARRLLRAANILQSNVQGRKAIRSEATRPSLVRRKGGITRENVPATGERGIQLIDPDDNRPSQVRLREALGERNTVTPEEIRKAVQQVLTRKGSRSPSLGFRKQTIAKGKDVNVLMRPEEIQEVLNSILLSRLSSIRGAIPKGGGTLRLPKTDPEERIAVMRAGRYGASGGRKPILSERPDVGSVPTQSLGYYLRGAEIKVDRSQGKLMIRHSKSAEPIAPADLIKQLEEYAPKLAETITTQRAALRKIRGGTPESKAAARQLGELERLQERIPKIVDRVRAAVRNAERETQLPVTRENLMSIEEAAARRNERAAAKKGADDSRHFDSPEESLQRAVEESGAVEGAARQASRKRRLAEERGDNLKPPTRLDKTATTALRGAMGPRPSRVPADVAELRKAAGLKPISADAFRRLAKLGDIKSLGIKSPRRSEMTPFEAKLSSKRYLESVGGSRFRTSELEKVRSPEAVALTRLGKQVIESMDSQKSMRGGLRDTAAKFLKMQRMADELVKNGKLSADNAKSILNQTVESLMRTEGGDTVIRMLQKHSKPETYGKIRLVPQPKPEQRRPATGRVPAGKPRPKRQGLGPPKEAPASRDIVETNIPKGEFQPRTPSEEEIIAGFQAWRKERAEQRKVGLDPDRRVSVVRGGKTSGSRVVELTDEGSPLKTLQEMMPKTPPQKAGKPVQGPKPRTPLTPQDIRDLLRIARKKRKKGTYTGIRRPID